MGEVQNRKGNVPLSSLVSTQKHLLKDCFLTPAHLLGIICLRHSPLFFFFFLFQNHSQNSSVQQLFLNFFTAVFIPTIHRQCLCACLCGVCGCVSFVSAYGSKLSAIEVFEVEEKSKVDISVIITDSSQSLQKLYSHKEMSNRSIVSQNPQQSK